LPTLTTPESIRTFQRKLYVKAKQEPAYRFYALYDKLYRVDILSHAYRLVRANKGSPGVDGMTFEVIEQQKGIDVLLSELRHELRDKTYRPDAVRRVLIPKTDGSTRPLGIPTIRDRVVQMAVKLVIEPISEADFCANSYGFRPQKSAHQAVEEIATTLHHGYTRIIDADLSKYFDSIAHSKLLAVMAERIVDGAILHLLKQWLKAPVQEENERGIKTIVGGGKTNNRGTPQGGVISPLLANCYLHLLDRIWERHQLREKLDAHIVRYADDFVVMCKRDVERPMATIKHILQRLDLTLNESKTHIVDADKESFNFLGFEIRRCRSWRTNKRYPQVNPSARSLARIKTKLKQMTGRNRTSFAIEEVIGSVNTVLRGWVGYFHFRNSSNTMRKLRNYTEERVRIHLMKRHKVKDRGTAFKRFPSASFYTDYGLYKVPTTAGWKQRKP